MLTLARLAARHADYLKAPIPEAIADCDDMFEHGQPHALASYLRVGRSAIDLLTVAMLSAGLTEVASVLDLPCGGGRVTRHLRAFLPEAKLFVGDLVEEKRRFAADLCEAEIFEVPPDFCGAPARTFDLIFVGSLLTHFNIDRFLGAVRWFIEALTEDGLLIVTTHGRRYAQCYPDAARYGRARVGFGFGGGLDNPTYGTSMIAPSWLLRLVEDEPALRIVGFREAAWNEHQDVLAVQRRTVG